MKFFIWENSSPFPPLNSNLLVPGDKSISHRAVIFAALSRGLSTITGFLESEDCLATVTALQQLGARIENPSAGTLIVHGTSGILKPPSSVIECGNSGTTMRLLSGVLAAQPFSSELSGDASLSSRPMARVIEPLKKMGASITAQGEKKRPPLFIEGKALHGIRYKLPIPSAQVKSALLLAALFSEGETTIIEPISCRDHTERMLGAFQLEYSLNADTREIKIIGPQKPLAYDLHIPGDISSAAFWIVAAAVQKGSLLKIKNVGLNPRRTVFLNVLQRMGADISIKLEPQKNQEPSGCLIIRGTQLHSTTIEGSEIPNLIDELPILAVAGALANGTTIIKDAGELRVKETDRIKAIVMNLSSLGADITEHQNGFTIQGSKPLRGASLDSYGDHRIAMAMAIASLFSEGTTTIANSDCIATSYPEFEETLTLLRK